MKILYKNIKSKKNNYYKILKMLQRLKIKILLCFKAVIYLMRNVKILLLPLTKYKKSLKIMILYCL